MDHNETKTTIFVTEFDQVSVLLPSYSAINNGTRMTPYLLGYLPLSPLSSHPLQFFQRVSNHSIKEKEIAAETFQYPVIIYVCFGPSSRCYMSELLFAIDGFLLLHQILATQHICTLDVVTVLFTFTLTLCSIFHLELIAWESYEVIRKWKDYRVIVTKKRLKKQALIAWISATVSVQSPNLIIMAVGGQSTVSTPAVP